MWETSADGRVILVRNRPAVRSPRSLAHWFWYMMAPPRIRLDAVGSFAWLAIDGRSTVGELSHRVRAEFGSAAEPVEHRLGHLVRVLRRERFLSYPELEEPR